MSFIFYFLPCDLKIPVLDSLWPWILISLVSEIVPKVARNPNLLYVAFSTDVCKTQIQNLEPIFGTIKRFHQ